VDIYHPAKVYADRIVFFPHMHIDMLTRLFFHIFGSCITTKRLYSTLHNLPACVYTDKSCYWCAVSRVHEHCSGGAADKRGQL